MSARIASLFFAIGLFVLAGCAQRIEVRDVTSAQVSVHHADSDVPDRALTSAQVAALSNWMKTREDWSGLSADIPEHPTMQVQMQDASGQSSNIDVYEHDDGTATVYLYQGHRVAPLRSRLSASDLATLKSAINQQ